MKKTLVRIFASPLVRVFLALVLGFLFLYLALKGVSWDEVALTLQRADPGLLWLALGFTLLNIFLKIVRWSLLLKSASPNTHLIRISASFLTSQLLNSMAPLRLGDISRIFVFSGERGRDGEEVAVEPGFILGTILSEKYLDVLAYGVLVALVPLSIPLPPPIQKALSTFTLFSLLAFSLIWVFIVSRGLLNRVIAWFSRGHLGKFGSFFSTNLLSGLESLSVLKNPVPLFSLLLVTVLIWVTALVTNLLVWQALHLTLPFEAAILLLVALIAGISLPALPGKIGTFEYASILALSFFGIDRSTSLSYGILLHVVVFAPIIFLGVPSSWYLQFRAIPRVSK